MRYWMGVASHEHVQRGIKGGFAQICHGKIGTLKYMAAGDWLIYYSPTYHFGKKDACRCFTAIGTIDQGEPYTFERAARRNPSPRGPFEMSGGHFAMSQDFIPWRRSVTFVKSREIPIEPLLEELIFIKDKKKWGFPFRRGSFEILRQDFELIAKNMGVI